MTNKARHPAGLVVAANRGAAGGKVGRKLCVAGNKKAPQTRNASQLTLTGAFSLKVCCVEAC